jgi:hypothetical protein
MVIVLDFDFENILQSHSALTAIAGEITEREPYNGYSIFQGGIPEVEEFFRKFHK